MSQDYVIDSPAPLQIADTQLSKNQKVIPASFSAVFFFVLICFKGKLSLHIKTIERQHLPSQLWEVIPLDKNLEKALAQLDDHLEFWPSYIVNKNKQRLLKITQYLIRMRKLKLQPQ